MVVGAGIFRTPSAVAGALADGMAGQVLGLWLAGGAAALAGALCYADLASRVPSIGGEYHFLRLAWGRRVAALFIWARLAAIQTGAMATVAFVAGDHAAAIWPDDPFPGLWAGLFVALAMFRLRSGGDPDGLRVPLYPLLPLLFLAACLFML